LTEFASGKVCYLVLPCVTMVLYYLLPWCYHMGPWCYHMVTHCNTCIHVHCVVAYWEASSSPGAACGVLNRTMRTTWLFLRIKTCIYTAGKPKGFKKMCQSGRKHKEPKMAEGSTRANKKGRPHVTEVWFSFWKTRVSIPVPLAC
jgi:hypothetical protein